MTLLNANRRRPFAILFLALALIVALALRTATITRADQAANLAASTSAVHALSSASATDRANAVKTIRVRTLQRSPVPFPGRLNAPCSRRQARPGC